MIIPLQRALVKISKDGRLQLPKCLRSTAPTTIQSAIISFTPSTLPQRQRLLSRLPNLRVFKWPLTTLYRWSPKDGPWISYLADFFASGWRTVPGDRQFTITCMSVQHEHTEPKSQKTITRLLGAWWSREDEARRPIINTGIFCTVQRNHGWCWSNILGGSSFPASYLILGLQKKQRWLTRMPAQQLEIQKRPSRMHCDRKAISAPLKGKSMLGLRF